MATKNDGSVIGCGFLLVVFAGVICLGGACFDYVLEFVFGKDIPFIADCFAGLVLGELAIPAAIICWILELCGIVGPLVG